MKSINHLVSELKENGEDFSFYPTTDEIINIIKRSFGTDNDCQSILDCGAGNGETLTKLTDGKKYAIEKSQILVNEMSPDIFIVGCNFFENSLIDKKVDVVFSNPPYSQYKEWATKIINEANSKYIILVIPERWKNNEIINEAIRDRNAEVKIIGSADFMDAERKARAKVDILRINLQYRSYYRDVINPDIDPFTLWVSKEFPINERTNPEDKINEKDILSKKVKELVIGRDLVQVLVELYQNEMMILQNNFKSISEIDASLFKELNLSFKTINEFLKNRIVGLKEKYWRELFSNLKPITNRLTVESREKLLETLTNNISVDFIESNIYAVTAWAIKNANNYFNSQLIDVFIGLSERANIVNYKSNQKTWGNDCWRFREEMRNGDVKNFGLDYRCVISCHNTFSTRGYASYDYPNGLYKNIHNRLNNILVIANNLGFCCNSSENTMNRDWEPGTTQDFHMCDGKILMSVKAYKNGNIHIKFNQKFLRALNVQFGKLKGWIRSPQEAAEELNIPEIEAKEYFKPNFVLECSGFKLLN